MSTGRKIVIVGSGPAGVAAALAARQQDAGAEVVLLSDEPHEPYEKPPLSKAVLTGKAQAHDAPIAGPKGVVGSGVTLERGVRVRRSIAARGWSSRIRAGASPTTHWC
jgi:3-phenylpropionate/trans-cinnamate dioxygenase ferredoxin reductase subunit